MILLADSEGPDQTARTRSMIWAYAVHICPKTFSHGTARLSLKTVSSRVISARRKLFSMQWIPIQTNNCINSEFVIEVATLLSLKWHMIRAIYEVLEKQSIEKHRVITIRFQSRSIMRKSVFEPYVNSGRSVQGVCCFLINCTVFYRICK